MATFQTNQIAINGCLEFLTFLSLGCGYPYFSELKPVTK